MKCMHCSTSNKNEGNEMVYILSKTMFFCQATIQTARA